MISPAPDIPTTESLAEQARLPVVQPLPTVPDVEQALQRFSKQPHCLFLDSAMRHAELGRYSFLTCDPIDYLEVAGDGSDGLEELRQRLDSYSASTVAGLPPFQGGAAGLLSYDLCHSLERLPRAAFDEFQSPGLAIGIYDVVVAIDHTLDQAWIISHGFPECDGENRCRRAIVRANEFRSWLEQPVGEVPVHQTGDCIERGALAPQFAVDETGQLTSSFTAEDYRDAVQRAIDYIHAGDVFQVNLAQRLLHPAAGSVLDLYLRLRKRNPATFAAYFDLGNFQIASASPERFISVRDRQVEARPIKGTRPVIRRPEADLYAGDELRQSEKDRAENVMITDLLRNDISRVCRADSVHVTDLCRLEVYEYVQHLVSVVRGELADGKNSLDAVRATFPGGSVTGAPKVRAMEIIAELEPTARGPYCGSLGYIGFDGALDLSILIRTITAGRGWWQLPVGGGIIAQSDPVREYEETWHKAVGLIKALS